MGCDDLYQEKIRKDACLVTNELLRQILAELKKLNSQKESEK